MFTNDNVIKLFSDCIITKGNRRSIICDLNRQYYKFIPNILFEILTIHKNKSIGEIIEYYDKTSEHYIVEYFEFLVKNDFGFICDLDEVEMFPEMDDSFEEPSLISNAILDFSQNSNFNYPKILNELSKLGCSFIQLRFYDQMTFSMLDNILKHTLEKNFISIQLVIKENKIFKIEDFLNIYDKYAISSIYIHSAAENKKIDNRDYEIYFSTQQIKDETHCGVVHPSYFTKNIKHYTESLNFNSCLNKKISIDSEGRIKNCPSLKSFYGHANTDTLESIVDKEKFKELWFIKKDDIKVCKDCEFRHICTDCRAYINKFEKPSKCKYNPYEAKWE